MLTQSFGGRAERPVVHVVERRVRRRRRRRRAARLDDRRAALLHGRDERLSRSTPCRRDRRRPCRRPRAWNRSGYCVAEWLPQIVMWVTAATGTSHFSATCAIARLWSRRVIAVNRSRGIVFALFIAMRQFVFAGLPTTRTRTSSAAPAASALPCTVKIAPFASSRSLRSMPFVRGRDADEQRVVDAVERGVGVVARVDAGKQRERAVVQLHHDALAARRARA